MYLSCVQIQQQVERSQDPGVSALAEVGGVAWRGSLHGSQLPRAPTYSTSLPLSGHQVMKKEGLNLDVLGSSKLQSSRRSSLGCKNYLKRKFRNEMTSVSASRRFC